MKTLKKLFSVSAIVALLGTLAPMYAFGATYTDELEDAYAYARANGVTTKNTIDQADMYGSLTRIAMAKMIANYATSVLGLEADTSRNCTFSDVPAALDAEYGKGVTNACQLGLMGIDDNGNVKATFDPKGIVTRAQFATALSRAISQAEDGEAIANGNPYYRTHIAYLNGKGIVKSEAEYDVNSVEKRGYVMLMMMRADNNYTPAEGCTTEQIVACALEDDTAACLAACSGNEEPEEPEIVKNGTLTVTVKDHSSDVISAPINGTVVANKINLRASEEIVISSLTLKKAGLFNNTAVYKVWFEKDGVRVSSKASMTSDGTATVNFTKGLTVKSNEDVDLVISFNGTDLGAEVAFTIDSLDTTAEKVNINSAETTKYRLANYDILKMEFSSIPNTPGTQIEYKVGDQDEYEFGKFKVTNVLATNVERDGLLKSITLTTDNSDVESLLTDIRLVRDGKNVAKSIEFDGKKLTIALDDTIAAGKVATYTLYAKVATLADDNEVVQFYLKDEEDIVAQEATTSFRTWNITTCNNMTTYPTSCTTYYTILQDYKVNGGNIVLKGDSTLPTTIEAGAGSSDVQIAAGTLSIVDPVTFDKLVLTETSALDAIQSMRLEIGGRSYSASIDTATHTYTFEDIYVNKASSVKLYVTLKSVIAGTPTIKFDEIMGGTATPTLSAGEYSNGTRFAAADIAGVINVSDILVKTPTFTLKNDLSSTVKMVLGASDTVKLFSGTLVSTKNEVTLSEVEVTPVTALKAGDSINFTLNVNGKTISKSLDSTTPSLVFPISNVVVNSEAKTITLEATPVINNATPLPANYVYAVQAKGTTNNNDTNSTVANSATLQVVAAATLTVSNADAVSKAVIEGNGVELATFTVNVKNGSTTLNTVDFAGTFDASWATKKVDLEIDGEHFEGTVASTTAINVPAMNKFLTAGTYTAKLTTDVNTDNKANGVAAVVTSVALNAGTPTDLNLKYIFVKAFPRLSKVNAENNELTIKIENVSQEDIKVPFNGGITVTNGTVQSLNGQSSATYEVTIAPGQSVNAIISVDPSKTLTVNSITYSMQDDILYTYTLNTDYTNVADWGTLKLVHSN